MTVRFLPLFAAIVAIAPFALDLYLPGMLAISESLGTGIQQVQNSLSTFLIGYATGMFVFGPLADRVGRRPLVLLGLSGFCLTSLLLARVETIEWFLALRTLQALFGGAATVVIPGAIRQLFGKDTAKGLSYVSMIMMLAPMIAPTIGSQILLVGNWRWIFLSLAAYAAIALVIAYFKFPALEDASLSQAQSLSFIRRYQRVLGEKYVHKLLLTSMLASLVFFTYITSVAFIYMHLFHFNENQFSLLFGLNVVGLMAASFINTRLVPRFGSHKILPVAASLATVNGVCLLLAAKTGLDFGSNLASAVTPSMVTFIALLMLTTALMMVISANSDGLILQKMGQHAGTAAAVIGSLRFGSGALGGPLLAYYYQDNLLPVTLLITGASFCIGLAVWAQFRHSVESEHVPMEG